MSSRPLAISSVPGSGTPLRERLTRESLRPVAIWAALLALGVLLLYLRFDRGAGGGEFADRGFVLSAYLFVILIPTSFYLGRRILRSSRVAGVLSGILFVVTTLPYHLLSLDDHYYYGGVSYLKQGLRPHLYYIDIITPKLEFFPGGMLKAFPYDYLFWPGLFLAGLGIIWGVWWMRNRASVRSRRLPLLISVAFAAICLQSAAHTSMRAPYTYLAYFQVKQANGHWYHVYHFKPDRAGGPGLGASEGDQYAYSPIEDYFQGASRRGTNILIRRPFGFYLASQVDYFVNSYYVWLGLNVLFWLAAVVATGRFVARVASERAGLIAAALTVVGPGFVAFVATPASYMQFYAVTAIALCLFEELVVRNRGRDPSSVALFTGVLALCALTYDLLPLFVVLLAYGLARTVRPWPLVASLVGAYALYRGFTVAVTAVLGIHIDTGNSQQISNALGGVKDKWLDPSLSTWYDDIVHVFPSYLRLLLQAFFIVPVLVALFGFRKLDRALQILVIAFLATSFAFIALLQIGGRTPELDSLPRLVYPIFPAIYLLAAVALDPGERSARSANASWRDGMHKYRRALPWVVVGLLFVLANFDIFGYPTLYVEFFVSDPPAFVP